MESTVSPNEETTRAWNGPLFDRFVQFREVVIGGLGAHGEAALSRHSPRPGDRVVDIGCGFGDTTQQIAGIVGPDGAAVGVDVAERFIEAARAEAAGLAKVRFAVMDVETTPFDEKFDFAFSRMGTMFFANPVAALRNIREALEPGGRLCMSVWRQKADNDWLHRGELIVKGFVDKPDDSDEPTCGPGPFSMANADTVSGQLVAAGFRDVELHRVDIPILMGRDLDEAIALITAIGPGGEVLRLLGDRADGVRPAIEAALREGLAPFVSDAGVYGPASTWTVAATA